MNMSIKSKILLVKIMMIVLMKKILTILMIVLTKNYKILNIKLMKKDF